MHGFGVTVPDGIVQRLTNRGGEATRDRGGRIINGVVEHHLKTHRLRGGIDLRGEIGPSSFRSCTDLRTMVIASFTVA